ncbi:MAG: hypothetical protein KOO63_09060, partial [Bacteroidales bacterium]|nr:hypothetical protein [Candidatus Latescibacterota bacterium]
MKKQNGKTNCLHDKYSRLLMLPGDSACRKGPLSGRPGSGAGVLSTPKGCSSIIGAIRQLLFLLMVLPLVLLALPLNAQIVDTAEDIWNIDLLDISEQIEVRYYMAENEGRVPPKYLLINNICFFPNFLQSEFDLRKLFIEYDPITGRIFKYRVPRTYSFSRTEERDGVYYVRSMRNVDIPGMSIRSYSLDERADVIGIAGFKKSWISDIRYNLQRERQSRRSGGLIDLNIPIKLPKQIEWLIGDGEETRLTVSGKETITIGGTSKWCANCPVTEGRPKQQKFPDLDMEQQLTVNLHGNIGEKIHVNIDHSSMGSGMGSTNRVSLNYEGLDDEIIRSIEMGDTDLTLSGAQLISYSGAAKGLFGVKVKAQLGIADITMIASKEEGESATGSYSGTGGQSSETTIPDYNYIKRQYFYFETPGESFETPQPGFINSSIRYFPVIGGSDNDMIEVFISLEQYELQNYQGGAKLQLKACADPENDGVTGDEEDNIVQWYGILRENDATGQGDYSLIQLIGDDSQVRYLGIRLNSPLRDTKSLAARYKSDGGFPDEPAQHFEVGDYNIYPDIPEEEILLAELICPEADNQSDPKTKGRFWSTWNMMFRNIYSLGGAGLADGAIKVRIDKVSTIIGTKYIQKDTGLDFMQIFGLDQENTEGLRAPDGLVDDKKGVINYYYGYIQFPWFEPFKIPKSQLVTYLDPAYEPDPFYTPSAGVEANADSVLKYLELNEMIYLDYVKEGLNNPPNNFDIVIETSSGSRTFQLNAFDIIQGTEVVSVDGEKLSAGTDYTIDYLSGTVTLKGDRLLTMTSDSRVSIEYQHKPLVGGGKTSLLGIGANFNISSNSRMNASFLYNSVGTPRYNPRLGDEPTRMMAADINGSFQFYPQWMTSMANMLPRVDTDAQSSLNISGEVAVSIPNPNTKGEAFVDDMEGVENSDQVTVVRKLWYEASPPIDPLNPGSILDPVTDADFFWYNPVREETSPLYKYTSSKRDLNPRLDARENSAIASLFLKTIDPQPGDWCGVMTGFAGGLDVQTAQYLEIWVNDFTLDPEDRNGVIHIDFGRIDEDFHQPELDAFDDERQIDWTNEYDTGFPDDDLGVYPTNFDNTWNDNWKIYNGINSRENNNYHDTEDLNRNSRHDVRNEYYSLTLNLADTALIDIQRDFPKDQYSDYWNDATKTEAYGGGQYQVNRKKSWRMYRLDLSKVENPSGIPPRMDALQHIRIWVENPFELRAQAENDGLI